MTSKESSGRQCSVESGLTQVIPALLCIPEKDIKAPKTTGPDHLCVPASSKMAKMRKKMPSPLSKRKGSNSESSESLANSSKVFGVSLEESIKWQEGPPIPWVVVRIVQYLTKYAIKNEGIFRVNGNKKNADMMKAAFDRDNDADLEEIGDVMAVAGLLKQYLRDLPEPPIPQSLTQEFIQIHTDYGNNDSPECIEELQDLIARLPRLNYQLVKYLCTFLVKVTKHEANNKMSAMALAIVFGPNLFRCKDGLEGLKEQGHTNAIVCKFLQEYDKLFPDDDEVSPYATTDICNITTPSSPDSIDTAGPSFPKALESSTSDEETLTSNKTTVEISIGKPQPVYAYIDKHKKQLTPSASSSSEELDLYVRSVSPSNGNNSSNSCHSTAQPHHHGPQGRDFVQNAIKDSVKEHLFGPELESTDENECSPNESELSVVHSAESLEETVPPLPARNYGPEDTNRPLKRRRNAKKQKELHDVSRLEGDVSNAPSISSQSVLMVNIPAMDNNKELVITLDQNSNSIVQLRNEVDNERMDEQDFTGIKRNSEILSTLTKHQAPPPSNRRSQSVNPSERNSQSDVDEEEETDGRGELPKTFVHPLVEEAKSRGKISTPPPRSPRSSPRVSKSPPSPLSPNKHATVDEVDGGYNPVKELMTRQHKKRSAVPPLELYKLQQGEGDENIIKHDVQLSPRERYDGFSADEALLSPRSRPLSVDTKSYYSTECPPSPPHDHIEPFWSDRRMESPKGELSLKQISRNIHQLKKKIKEFEEEFEAEHGHKPSQSEKAPIKKYLSDLTRYRKEFKELKEKAKEDSERLIETVPSTKQEAPTTNSTAIVEPLLTTTPATVQQSLDNILTKLQDKRKAMGRSEDLQSLTLEELQDEKLCVQKALLQHESVFGRPTSKKDKDIMRPLYDRYRLIKRKVNASRSQSSAEDLLSKAEVQNTLNDQEGMGSEEHLFATTTLLPTSMLSPLSQDLSKAQKRRSDISTGSTDDLDNCSDFGGSQENLLEDKERDAKLHHMSREELQKQSELAKREKKRLRKKLKKFEDDFLERTGRRVQRDERGEMDNDYREYKEIKARLRLIDVLLTKRQASHTI